MEDENRRNFSPNVGHTPQYGWDFPEEIPENFRKDPGNALRAFPGVPLESTAGMPPKPYNSRHLRLPERFPRILSLPIRAGDASLFRIGSGEGLSELVMEFPAVLGVFLKMFVTFFRPCQQEIRQKFALAGYQHLERPTRQPQHASVFSTHSDTQAVPAFHCIRMFKGKFFDTSVF